MIRLLDWLNTDMGELQETSYKVRGEEIITIYKVRITRGGFQIYLVIKNINFCCHELLRVNTAQKKWGSSQMPNSERNDEECDATVDDSSNAVGSKKSTPYLYGISIFLETATR